MKMRKQTVVLISVTLFTAIGSSIALAGKKSEAASMCDAAEKSRKAAAEVKMEWTTTAGLIKSGKKAIASGQFEEAIKLCEKAKFQGDASVKQAAIEAKAWQARVPQ